MVLTKYNNDNRSNFVIVSSTIEELEKYRDPSDDTVLNYLNTIYNPDKAKDIPYNYVVTNRGILELKSTNIAHTDISIYSIYNDDIKILLCNDELLKDQQEEIISLIASLSLKYCMKISDSVIFIKNTDDEYSKKIIQDIEKKSIQKRNLENPIYCIYEAVIDNKIVINDDIIMINNRDGYINLDFFSNKYSIDLKTLIYMNPHIDTNSIKNTDIIFIPKTTALSGLNKAKQAKRQVEYILNECTEAIKEAIK